MLKINSLPRGTVMRCKSCGEHASFPSELTVSMLPAAMACPHCDEQSLLSELPVLPKSVMMGPPKYWSVSDGSSSPLGLGGSSGESSGSPATAFEVLATAIKTLLTALLSEASSLTEEVNELKRAFLAEFSEQHRLCEIFKACWDQDLLGEFILNPFGILPVACENRLVGRNSRLIFSPRFFTPSIGISVGGYGGMQAEVINPYIRIGKPVGTVLADYLGIDKQYMLSVKEDKIFGEDCEEVAAGMPGLSVAVEVDSVNGIGFCSIVDSRSARMHLAMLGIPSWERRPIDEASIMPRIVDYIDIVGTDAVRHPTQDIRNDTVALDLFMKNSRTGLFWENEVELTKCAFRITKRITGRKVVLCGDGGKSDRRSRWSAAFQCAGRGFDSTYIFISDAENFHPELIADVPAVIVDTVSQPDVRLLDVAYHYSGPLLLLGNDPLLDYDKDNWLAPLYYGLVNSVMFGEVSAKPASESSFVSAAIVKALKKLRQNSAD